MKKEIELTRNAIARLSNVEPFLLPDNLELEFFSKEYSLRNVFISLQNGDVKGQYKYTKPFNVDNRFLFAGKLNIGITMYIDGEIAKRWSVSPITIKETHFGIVAFEKMTLLSNEVKEIKENYVSKSKFNKLLDKVNELAEKHNQVVETVNAIKENF